MKITISDTTRVETGWDDPHRDWDESYPSTFVAALRAATYRRFGRRGGGVVLDVDRPTAEWLVAALQLHHDAIDDYRSKERSAIRSTISNIRKKLQI